jgi:phage terminase large subunit-like protein
MLTHDGDSTFSTHVLNAHKRSRGDLYAITKDRKHSPHKIDAAVAATLAYAARTQAIEEGTTRAGWARKRRGTSGSATIWMSCGRSRRPNRW